MLSTQSTQQQIADLEDRLERALVSRVPDTDPAVVRCQFFLDLLREGVVRVGDGPVSPTIEDAISSLCRATDERDPLTTRRSIRDAGRTYAHEATRSPPCATRPLLCEPATATWSQRRVFASPSPAVDAPSEPSDEVDL